MKERCRALRVGRGSQMMVERRREGGCVVRIYQRLFALSPTILTCHCSIATLPCENVESTRNVLV